MNFDNIKRRFKDSEKAERNSERAKQAEKKIAFDKLKSFERQLGIKTVIKKNESRT